MNPIEEIQQWIDAILSAVDEITQSGEVIPDHVYAMIADEIESAQNEMMMLQQQEVQTQIAPEKERLPKSQMPSSNVYGYHYDPESGDLLVQFQDHSGGSRTGGKIYKYESVPPDIAEEFIAGNREARTLGENQFGAWWPGKIPSIGAAHNELIKQGPYPYRRVA